MNGEKEEEFELIDIMRYTAPDFLPEGTSQAVVDAICEYSLRHLLDIYLLAGNITIRALLHPSMYSRVLKGWLKIGSIIKIQKIEGDMIVELEPTGAMSKKDLTKIKKETYITLPNPIYNPKTYYMPLLSDEEYMKWDRRWKRYIEEYSERLGDSDEEVQLHRSETRTHKASSSPKKKESAERSKKKLSVPIVNCDIESEEEDRPFKRKMPANRLGYNNTHRNFITGQVILKSRLFSGSPGKAIPLMFSFVLRTKTGIVKVYVWEGAVRKFFCVEEGSYIAVRGFKIKRRPGRSLELADRMRTDKDTKYSNIPEININTKDPEGHIMKIDKLPGLFSVKEDSEFTTVVGTVEYTSPLLREKDAVNNSKKLRGFVFLKVSGAIVKLASNGCTNTILDVKVGFHVEIRHLRKAIIGSFVFYVSSMYTQIYKDRTDAPLFDGAVVAGESTGTAEENALGYIPVVFSTFSEHIAASKKGIGYLVIDGVPVTRELSNSKYLHRDKVYFGEVCSIPESKQAVGALYMDETLRFIVFGTLSAVRYGSLGNTTIGESTFDVSYIAADATMCEIKNKETNSVERVPESACSDKIEENIVVRIESKDSFLDLQVFQNHLVHSSFEESVLDFLKIKQMPSNTVIIYEELEKRVGKKYYFVVDAVRVNDEVVLHIGVSLLKPSVGRP